MTIDEAISNLSIQREVKMRLGKSYQADALKLGIEALKRIDICRCKGDLLDLTPLPGETED